ncbi:MAG: hypothetical protein H7831_11670 [Magnetococcus sp. WYHC-3]
MSPQRKRARNASAAEKFEEQMITAGKITIEQIEEIERINREREEEVDPENEELGNNDSKVPMFFSPPIHIRILKQEWRDKNLIYKMICRNYPN